MPIRIRDDYGELTSSVDNRGETKTGDLADQVAKAIRQAIFAYGPVAPQSMVDAPIQLNVAGDSGETATVTAIVRNCQRAAVVVSPRLGPATNSTGTTWRPVHQLTVDTSVLQPGESTTIRLQITIPAALDPGIYQAAIHLAAVSNSGSVRIEVLEAS